MSLWKVTAVMWFNFNPKEEELHNLAWEASYGDGYCSYCAEVLVKDPLADEHPPSEEFFWLLEE